METDRPIWRSRAWISAALVVLVLVAVLAIIGVEGESAAWIVLSVSIVIALSAVTWALIRTRRQRRRYEEELAAWAGERAAQSERLRIAADLHDLVSHGLGVMTMRAAVAGTVTGVAGDADRVQALADIERVSRETTTELRRMLTVLRDPASAPRRPADTLADLPAIVRDAEAAGVTVTLEVDPLDSVSAGIQLTVCAIVREALHNTVRHAGPTQAAVRVFRAGADVVVTVEDAGARTSRPASPGAGHGLIAVRDRVAFLGGAVHTQPSPAGFRLTARIPDRVTP